MKEVMDKPKVHKGKDLACTTTLCGLRRPDKTYYMSIFWDYVTCKQCLAKKK